ncbi:MAG: prepilin peptidase [Patescibacteria group bacterium]
MTFILIIIFFTFGLIIGSFLNVVILRYHTEKSFGGRSACMSCQNKLCWYELIPLLSFFALQGRCRNCQTKISWQYPLVECITGIIFAGIFWKFSAGGGSAFGGQNLFFTDTLAFTVSYAYYVTAFSLLLVIAVYDWKHKIIPDTLAFVFGLLAFLGMFLFLNHNFYPHLPSLGEIMSGVVIALPFALIWFLSKGAWMGLGDAKVALGLGWLLGLASVLSGAVVAFWFGAIIGLLLIWLSPKYSIRSEIPFAPFLVLGAFLAFMLELHFFPLNF